MSSDGPSLDDLIRAQRRGVRMTTGQRAANRARLTSGLLAESIGAASTGSAASSVVVGPAGAVKGWLAKAALGIVLTGGAGAAYVYTRHPAPGNVAPQQATTARQPSAPPAAAFVSDEPASPAPAIPSPVAQVQVTRRLRRSSAPDAPAASASLAVEVQLIHDVDYALKSGHPERALALLDERREGDGGYMREERAAARVFALCQLGRVELARASASQFLRDRPRSPLAARVRATCAAFPESPVPGKPK